MGALEAVRGPLSGGALGSSRGAGSGHREKQGELTLGAPTFLFSFLLTLGGVHTLWQTRLSLISFFQKLLTQVQVFRDGETLGARTVWWTLNREKTELKVTKSTS